MVALVGELTPKVLSALPYGVLLVDRDWRVTFANLEAERLLGSGGHTLWERCPELEATAFANAFRYAMADRAELISETMLPQSGWVQARARPLDDGLLISLRSIFPEASDGFQTRHGLIAGEIGQALARSTTMAEMLQSCAESLVRNLGAKLVRIWTYDTKAVELVLEGSAGTTASEPDMPPRVALARAKIGKIAERGSPYVTNDYQNDPRSGDRTWAQREGIMAFAAYPLRLGGAVLGVLAVYSHEPIGHDTTGALATVADSIALGIERRLADDARVAAQSELRTQAEQLELINEIGKNLTSELEVGPLALRVTNLATRLAGAAYGLFYVNDGGDTYSLIAASNAPRESLPSRIQRSQLVPQTFVDVLPTASFHVTPVIARGGRAIGALVFGHGHAGTFGETTEDLLDGVSAQAAIAIDNARLFEDARRLIETLERKNAELDQFAYVASHDLKAPLRGIANLSQWIEDDLGDKLDDQGRYHLGLLRGRVRRLEGLIEGILSYSRVGRPEADDAEVDTRAFTQEIWELLAPAPTASLVLGQLPTITTARVPLQQVLMNLMGNALKYNRDRALTVEVGAQSLATHTLFYVKDDGVGIAPEYHDRIWGLFQTLESRDRVESTGIGLAVVRKIVESRGGRAWVESAAGAGATFWFSWPADTRTRHG